MNTCDPNVAQIILAFSIGGVTLRALIAQLRNLLNVTGFVALALTFACCAVAVVVYMAFTGWAWLCFLFYTCLVFTGTQLAYRATHKKGY